MNNSSQPSHDPAEALERLAAGNRRFAAGAMEHPNQSPERRTRLIHSQEPFAAVLGCSDSRVAPEVIFDQGLGSLTVVRVAGNVVNSLVLASLEYAVLHLRVGLIVVLGHSQCGAVRVAANAIGARENLSHLISAIRPAISRQKGQLGDLVDNAAQENARLNTALLVQTDSVLGELVKTGKLSVVAAYYDQESGLVRFLDHTDQIERPLALD
jgi:carbonic anhydrase